MAFVQVEVIHVRCDDCGFIFTLTPLDVGKETNCPNCGAHGKVE